MSVGFNWCIMRRLLVVCVTTVGLVLSGGSLRSVYAQPGQSLSDSDRNLARQVEATAIQQLRSAKAAAPFATFSTKALRTLRATPAGKQERSVVTEINPIRPSGPVEAPQAMVSRYDYSTGLTFRTVVDLTEKKVVEIKADPNFPTPLAPEEVKRAVELAAQAAPEIATGAPEEAITLPLIDTAPTSPTYGHRLVVVWREGTAPSERVLVDLSMEAIAKPSY